MIEKFSKGVIEKLKYYVYKLIDPRNGQVFYVGKGNGNRVFEHMKCSIKYYDGIKEKTDDDPYKFRRINEILDEGLEVIHIIQRWHLTEEEALAVEAALIDEYQGLTNIQNGHHAEYGITNAESLERKYGKAYEEPIDFKYIIIKVKKSRLDELVNEFPLTNRYEATRYAWKITPRDVQEYPYVFSVTDGIVKEVYKIKEWYFVEELKRYAFNGEIAESYIHKRFVGKRIPDEYMKRGMASPVLFSKNYLISNKVVKNKI